MVLDKGELERTVMLGRLIHGCRGYVDIKYGAMRSQTRCGEETMQEHATYYCCAASFDQLCLLLTGTHICGTHEIRGAREQHIVI